MLTYSPTKTGFAWLATSLTAFIGAMVAGARLVPALGVKRPAILGMTLLTLAMLWLTRLPDHAGYLVDLFPAFLLAGFAIGFAAPTVQIGALAGVAPHEAGLASGVVETMREVGGAVGIAVVSTVLISRSSVADGIDLDGFKAAFAVIALFSAIGVAIAAIAFPRLAGPEPERSPEILPRGMTAERAE
jgi:MFS family permease